MEKVSVTFKLNPDDVAFLDKLAASSDRDRSYLIRQAVGEFIALHKWQLEDIDRAVGEADRGEFASDDDVQAMFKELRE
ncbi:MAG TPA: ribbon-helix-helix protein, CopG family [Pirellulales bacterium]|nr:ribbon-helix-helix protein, CopG family [Pirellulales bacterium]